MNVNKLTAITAAQYTRTHKHRHTQTQTHRHTGTHRHTHTCWCVAVSAPPLHTRGSSWGLLLRARVGLKKKHHRQQQQQHQQQKKRRQQHRSLPSTLGLPAVLSLTTAASNALKPTSRLGSNWGGGGEGGRRRHKDACSEIISRSGMHTNLERVDPGFCAGCHSPIRSLGGGGGG